MIPQTDVNDLYLDPSLTGGAMRDVLVEVYNKFAYWVEAHSEWDAKKKAIENALEEAKDKAKAMRAKHAEKVGMKAKIQEAYIRDFWDMQVEIIDTETGEIQQTTCSKLQADLSKAAVNETKTRHKMNICQTALDIGRTAVSWDKTEYARQGGNV
jgi:3-dehydroquinate synthase class II